MFPSYVIVNEITHGLWLWLQGLLPSLQIALNCNFSSCGFTMGTALYWTACGCTIAHCSLHWWAHSEKGSAALSEKGSAAAFLNWLLMMGAGTLSANFLIHTSGNSQPNMSCRTFPFPFFSWLSPPRLMKLPLFYSGQIFWPWQPQIILTAV